MHIQFLTAIKIQLSIWYISYVNQHQGLDDLQSHEAIQIPQNLFCGHVTLKIQKDFTTAWLSVIYKGFNNSQE